MSDFIFLGSEITADGDCSHEIKRLLLLGRKVTLAWTLGSSSRLPPLGHGVLLASAPDLGRGVAALGAAAHAKCAGRSRPH